MSRNRYLFSVFLIPFFLSACATNQQWTKPGATQADFQRDSAQCNYEAEINTPTDTSYRRYKSTGEAIGAGIAQGIATGVRKAQLYQACMQARGYMQAPVGSQSQTPTKLVFGIRYTDAPPASEQRGVVVVEVVVDSIAHKTGVKAGDIICEYNGTPVSCVPDMRAVIESISSFEGKSIPIKVIRDNQEIDFVAHYQ